MEWLLLNLGFFASSQQIALQQTVTEDEFSELATDVQSDIKYLFFQLSNATPKDTLDAVYNCLMEAILFDADFWIFRVNEGESFIMNIEKQPTEVSGKKIVAREVSTRVPVTLVTQDPVAEGIDRLPVIDLGLKSGGFYQVDVYLETDDNGVASGDAETTVAKTYFIVGYNIDSNAG